MSRRKKLSFAIFAFWAMPSCAPRQLASGSGQAPATPRTPNPEDGKKLRKALFSRNAKAFHHILETGASPDSWHVDPLNGKTKTPILHYAASLEDPVYLNALLSRGAKVDATVEEGPWDGETALLEAVKRGHLENVRALLAAGAAPDFVVKGNLHRPLMSAVAHPAVLEFLLARGVDVNAVDAAGRSAAIFAGMAGSEKAIAVLKRHDAKLDLKDEYGKTALDYLSKTKRGKRR
jgi:ankyrin repeat protein